MTIEWIAWYCPEMFEDALELIRSEKHAEVLGYAEGYRAGRNIPHDNILIGQIWDLETYVELFSEMKRI